MHQIVGHRWGGNQQLQLRDIRWGKDSEIDVWMPLQEPGKGKALRSGQKHRSDSETTLCDTVNSVRKRSGAPIDASTSFSGPEATEQSESRERYDRDCSNVFIQPGLSPSQQCCEMSCSSHPIRTPLFVCNFTSGPLQPLACFVHPWPAVCLQYLL